MTTRLPIAVLVVLALASLHLQAQRRGTGRPADRGVRVEITVPPSVRSAPLTGRVYFMVSRTDEREPRLQIGRTGTPFFGRDVENLKPGQAAIIDATDLGTPVASLEDLPPGDDVVQAFVNVYSEFRRADGHTVWMHDDQWEGQHWNISPGNLFSRPQRVRIDATTEPIRLVADQVIPPVTVPADTAFVKRIRIQSALLTRFWGRPIYLGATVLLPRDYDRSTVQYPVLYRQGHYSLAAPLGFQEGGELHQAWMRDDFPQQRNHFELELWMRTTENPHYEGFFLYGDGKGTAGRARRACPSG